MNIKIIMKIFGLFLFLITTNLKADTVIDVKSFNGIGLQVLKGAGRPLYTTLSVSAVINNTGGTPQKVSVRFLNNNFKTSDDKANLDCLLSVKDLGKGVTSFQLTLDTNVKISGSNFYDITTPTSVLSCQYSK
jgi:hypothetical protein